jgi:methionyl-tRNA formyltransferase
LVYGGPILKPELFQIPVFGTFGIHHGRVPEYRGKKTTFWAMFNGEREVGVTIQRISSRLDKGDVVRQGEVTTGSKSLSEVCRELEAMGVDLFVEAILDVKRGTAIYSPQELGPNRLYKDPSLKDLLRFHWRHLNLRLRSKGHA